MSPLFRQFLAGQLASVKEMTYFLAPVINSYKRFADQSFAPTTAVWSKDNRSAGYRVVGHGNGLRAECRIGGADVNPYLSFAAIIAAGLHGIENKLELEPEFRGDAYARDDIRFLPKTLREALDLLNRSEIMREALGDDVIDHYVHTGRWEQAEYDRRVTDWELLRGFERG